MTTDQIDAAISGLNRIRNRLYQADLLTRRARTPGREQHLLEYKVTQTPLFSKGPPTPPK